MLTIGIKNTESCSNNFVEIVSSDMSAHYATCLVLCFFGRELVLGLWGRGYEMSRLEAFLGADALFADMQASSILMAAWLDAVHHTVIAYGRHRGRGPPVQFLASRLKLFAIKFAKGPQSTKWLVEAISPSNAHMTQWT